MGTLAFLYMDESQRKEIIDNHQFYTTEASKRLLASFHDIEEAADQHGRKWLEKFSHLFNPEGNDDPCEFYEQANEKCAQHYQLLENMRNRTRLSVAAGMFHEWDKKLKNWLSREVRNHWVWWSDFNSPLEKAVWNADFRKIIFLLKTFGWPIETKSYYSALNRCRLIVNAYKHGNGNAFDEIKTHHHDFLDTLNAFEDDPNYLEYVDYQDLKIKESHITEFYEAIIAFWQDVPNIWKAPNEVPDWFAKALLASQNNTLKTA